MQADYWFLSGGRFDGQDVEPPRRIFQAARANKLASYAREVAPFFQVDSVLGSGLAWFSFGPRFHLDERENSAVIGDEVEFAFDSRHGEISRNHDVTLATQVPVGVSFATHAGSARELFGG